eukprot:scaffold34103_cov90-Cyclotella_meneghiniana.AAC.3
MAASIEEDLTSTTSPKWMDGWMDGVWSIDIEMIHDALEKPRRATYHPSNAKNVLTTNYPQSFKSSHPSPKRTY